MQVESKCSEEAKIVFVAFFGVLLVSEANDCMIFLEWIQVEPQPCNPSLFLYVEQQILLSLLV